MAQQPDEVDTRTYFTAEEESAFCSRCGADCTCLVDGVPAPHSPRAVMTREVIVGHEGFPCPATRGEASCNEAWESWRRTSGIQLLRL